MLSPRQLVRNPLPGMTGKPGTRIALRMMLLLAHRLVDRVENEQYLHDEKGPMIVALNHNQYLEALLVPGLLAWKRSGHIVHFFADWNFLMVPVVSTLFRMGEVIPVKRKAARPAFLTPLRGRLVRGPSGYALARRLLEKGRWVGVFPEGKANRDPLRLLPGFRGAARLALETGVPVLPIGIRFPGTDPRKPVPRVARMSLHIGSPIYPGAHPVNGTTDVAAMHGDIMQSLSRLSGKAWQP